MCHPLLLFSNTSKQLDPGNQPKSIDLLEGKSGAPRFVFFARVSISAYNSRLIFCLRARLKKLGPKTRPGVNPTYKINLDQQNQIVFKSSRFFYT